MTPTRMAPPRQTRSYIYSTGRITTTSCTAGTRHTPTSVSVQVNRASFPDQVALVSQPLDMHDFTGVDMSPLSMIPGFTGIVQSPATLGEPYPQSPQSLWMAQQPFAAAYSPPRRRHPCQ